MFDILLESITENGYPAKGENKMSVTDVVHDAERITYFSGMLENLAKAKTEDGVDVRGYFAWSMFLLPSGHPIQG